MSRDSDSLFDAPPLAEQERMIEAVLFASAEPVAKPPPPQQATSWSGSAPVRSSICSRISRPQLPCPSTIQGSSKLGTTTAPVLAARSAASCSREPPIRS